MTSSLNNEITEAKDEYGYTAEEVERLGREAIQAVQDEVSLEDSKVEKELSDFFAEKSAPKTLGLVPEPPEEFTPEPKPVKPKPPEVEGLKYNGVTDLSMSIGSILEYPYFPLSCLGCHFQGQIP